MPDLLVDSIVKRTWTPARGKKMNIYAVRKLRAKREKIQKRPSRTWECALRQRDLGFLGKDQDGAARHTLWIRDGSGDRQAFSCNALLCNRAAVVIGQDYPARIATS